MAASPLYELVVREGPHPGQRFALTAARMTIGAGEGCDLRFPSSLVRERHAELRLEQGRLEVVDLTGATLVWVNGEPLARGEVGPGQELRLGRLTVVVMQGDWNDSTVSGAGAKAVTLAPEEESFGNEATRISGRFGAGELIDGRYRIIDRLAAGGMGEVFKAEHVELGRTLAVKIMLPELSNNPEFVERFKLEAMAVSRIGHPNIVDVTDFGKTATGRFYFVMEYLDGRTLARIVEEEGALAPARAIRLVGQVARALAAVHEQKIVHRDLKPENVMVLQRTGDPDRVKVLDFGVARVQREQANISKTAAGVVVGTPQYMSPEQAQGIPVDARCDIYALGLILHELLTGKAAFTGATPAQVMINQVIEPPPPLPNTVPEPLRELVGRMLQKKPADRPQQMKEVIEALDRARTGARSGKRPAPAVQTSVAPRSARPDTATLTEHAERPGPPEAEPEVAAPATSTSTKALLAVLGALLLVLALGAAVLFSGGDKPTPQPPPVEPPAPVAGPKPDAPPAAPAEVLVRIESVPEGVEVLEHGVMLGNTPLPLKRPANSILELKLMLAGYQPAERKVRVSEDAAVVSVTLEKLKAPAPVAPAANPPKKPPRPKPDLKPAPF